MKARFLVACFVSLSALTVANALAFEIYTFIPYSKRLEDGKIVQGRPDAHFFERYGLHSINLVYEDRLLDPAVVSHGAPVIDEDKIRRAAQDAMQSGASLTALDLEGWNRFDRDTPVRLIKVIELFRRSYPSAKIGLYATVPQNTYQWHAEKREEYDRLNESYRIVAERVDYYSPSLYNYDGPGLDPWRESARYNVAAANGYSRRKVLPYITPEVWSGKTTTWLTYEQMSERIRYLKEIGADGCIVWTSSQSTDASGTRPTIDPGSGWFKAVIDAAATSATN